jgi:hypothetical protein
LTLKGRFDERTGAPTLDALLVLPRLDVAAGLTFLLDTGADRTVLTAADFGDTGISSSRLQYPVSAHSTGGSLPMYQEPGLLVFDDPDRGLYTYEALVGIIPESRAALEVPSFLGRDILNRWRITNDFIADELTVEFRSFDSISAVSRITGPFRMAIPGLEMRAAGSPSVLLLAPGESELIG